MFRKNLVQAVLIATTFAMVACDGDTNPAGPNELPTTTAGIRFNADGATYGAKGILTATTSASVFSQEFAVARSDSLDGVVVVGYDQDSNGSGNLFIIQAPEQTGTFACGPSSPCHGRYITGVSTEGDTSNPDRRFEITSGTLTISSLSSGRLTATFSGSLTADDQLPDGTLSVTDGTVDVTLLPDGATDGTLACMLSKVGVGSGTCNPA